MTANCGVTNLRITYWGRSMDGGRIDVYTDYGESYTCAKRERESAVASPMFIVRLLCITSTHRARVMFPDSDIVTLSNYISYL